jgi:hypothetical protein
MIRDVRANSEDSDVEDLMEPADMQALIQGNGLRQPGESLIDQEAGHDTMDGTRHLHTYNEGDITEDELVDLIGQSRVTKRHIYPLHGTEGFLGNMHTSKVVIVVGLTEGRDRICIRLKEETKCVHGLQAYNSSSRNDMKKQSRPSLDSKVKKLASLVSFYFTPYKTQAETRRIPDVLRNIRATLRMLKEAWSEQNFMAQRSHRRPVRVEFFYNETAFSFFEEDLLYPVTPISIAVGILQVIQHEVVLFHKNVGNHVIDPLFDFFGTSDTEPAPSTEVLDAGEKAFLAYAAEAAAIFYGSIAAEGPIFRTLLLNRWKSSLSFQPKQHLRYPARLQTYGWCRIPYRLKSCVRPCAFETGSCLYQIDRRELREKELRKLQLDIAVQMRNVVRIPFQYAKAKACMLGLLHKWGNLNSELSVDDTDPNLSTPGLFDDIPFEGLAQLEDGDRRQFLESAIDAILELYSAEWRDILNGKLVRSIRQGHTRINDRAPHHRGRVPTAQECALPIDIEMPVGWTEVCLMRTNYHASASVVSHVLGQQPIIQVNGEFVIVFVSDGRSRYSNFMLSLFLFLSCPLFVPMTQIPCPHYLSFFPALYSMKDLVGVMFRDFGDTSLPSNRQMWGTSPSRCAWMYLDHNLSYVRQVITDAGSEPVATFGRRIPYSREEVSDTLARSVMKQVDGFESTQLDDRDLSIVWRSAMGHQHEGQLQAAEVRINTNRPAGGTHDAVVPSPMRESPASSVLLDHKDSFHTLLLVTDFGAGGGRTYIMNILILRLATLVATRDFLLNGVVIPGMLLFRAIADSQIAESYRFEALYDCRESCLEAVKGCLKSHDLKAFFMAENMENHVQGISSPTKRALWALVTPHCNMEVMQKAARLVYHTHGYSEKEIATEARELTTEYGIFSFFGEGDDADRLNSTVVDSEGMFRQGNNYMHEALSLVAENGVVTESFTQALIAERVQFCKNRIKHIEATNDEAAADNGAIAEANQNLAMETFGSNSYKSRHDLDTKKRKSRT